MVSFHTQQVSFSRCARACRPLLGPVFVIASCRVRGSRQERCDSAGAKESPRMLHKLLAGHVETPPGLDYVGGFCGGLRHLGCSLGCRGLEPGAVRQSCMLSQPRDDYRRRFAYFRSDWLTDVMKGKTVSGAKP